MNAIVFKAGCFYRTRSGKKAFVAAVESPFGNTLFPVIGYAEGDRGSAKWTSDGMLFGECVCHDDDLIAEWKEPVTVTRWIALWSDGTVSSHTEPPKLPLSHLMAFKQVTITEGEGMP